MNLFDHFGATRIISLRDRVDRRRETREELRTAKLPFGGKVAFFDAICPSELRGFPSIGAHGCYMSHLGVLEHLVASKLPSLLVVEDDIRFSPDLDIGVEATLRTIDTLDWDILYFGRLDGPAPEQTTHRLRALDAADGVMGAHCYAVNARVAPRIVAYLRACLARPPGDPVGGPMHVDGAFSMFRAANPDVRTFLVEPYVASQRSSATDIDTRRWLDTLPVVRTLVARARTLRNRAERASRPLARMLRRTR
jgi:glycosyl transferase, family 25